MAEEKRTRRTQEERTAATKAALLEATARAIHKLGYHAAGNAEIAAEAGVSRGAIAHHFGTRAALIAEFIRWAFDQELIEYMEIQQREGFATQLADWPMLMWKVHSKPSALAVVEIIQASRSDPELAKLVIPMLGKVEEETFDQFRSHDPKVDEKAAAMRFMLWATRGLAIARMLMSEAEMEEIVSVFSRTLRKAAPNNTIDELLED